MQTAEQPNQSMLSADLSGFVRGERISGRRFGCPFGNRLLRNALWMDFPLAAQAAVAAPFEDGAKTPIGGKAALPAVSESR